MFYWAGFNRIYCFIEQGSIEEKIYQRQIIKQGLSGAVVDSLSTEKTEFSSKDLKVLWKWKLKAFTYSYLSFIICFVMKSVGHIVTCSSRDEVTKQCIGAAFNSVKLNVSKIISIFYKLFFKFVSNLLGFIHVQSNRYL